MKISLVRNDFMAQSGTVTVLAHKDDYDAIKSNLEKIGEIFSEVLAKPLFTSPPEGALHLMEKNIEVPDWKKEGICDCTFPMYGQYQKLRRF